MGFLWCITTSRGISLCVLNHSRHLSTSCPQAAKNYLPRQGLMMNKLISGSKKKRRYYFDETPAPSTGKKLTFESNIKRNKENNRRVAVLNKLFMRHISDLLVMENIGMNVLNKGLQISNISISPNFNQLNVFWGTSNEENASELESVLSVVGYSLRHELSQLGVMGIVPRIAFVRDKNYNAGAKVDELLRIADFGEDHVPAGFESDFKSMPKLQDKKKTKTLSDEDASDEELTSSEEVEMPEMRQDTFGLNHEFIMKKVMSKVHKSKAYHRFEPNLAISSDGTGVSSSMAQEVDNMTKDQRKEALAKFVQSRKINWEKKAENKHRLDINPKDFISGQSGEYDDCEDFEIEDYIEEEYVEQKFQY